MKNKLLTLLIALVMAATNLQAQEEEITCSSFLNNIATYYQDGNYVVIVANADSLLKKCNYSKEDKILIYKYVIAAEKSLNFDSLAEIHAEKMLKLDPFYEYNSTTDPSYLEDIKLNNTTFPRLTIGYYMGISSTQVDRITMYRILDSMDYSLPYTSTPSIFTSLYFNYNFSQNFSVGASGGVFYSNFSRELPAYNFIMVDYKERFSGGQGNLYFINKLRFVHLNKFVPYIKYGIHMEYNTRIRYEIQMSVYDETKYPDFNLPTTYERHGDLPLSSRRRIRGGIDVGGGFIYEMQKVSIFLEAYYKHDLVTYTIPESRYQPEFSNIFYYVNDDIVLNKLMLMIGFSFNLKYTVKKSN